MRTSDPELVPHRSRLAEILGGSPLVEEWEIVAMHRDHLTHKGTCCRVTWLRTDHADVDKGVEIYKGSVLPSLEEMDGFCSASMLVDRREGAAAGTVTFKDRASLERTRDAAAAIRERASQEIGVDFVDVAEFELVLAHLRVPETV